MFTVSIPKMENPLVLAPLTDAFYAGGFFFFSGRLIGNFPVLPGTARDVRRTFIENIDYHYSVGSRVEGRNKVGTPLYDNDDDDGVKI